MNLFEQYGIKEVADVTLYSIHKKQDGSGDLYYVPALYLDTLKVSTVEKTGESTWAEGGLGNSRLINWDYGKTINVTLEDALCTPASLGLCWDGILSANWKNAKVQFNTAVCGCQNPLKKISRMEKAFYPREDRGTTTISNLLPQVESDAVDNYFGVLKISSVVDGTDVRGFGMVKNHTYRWKMAVESAVKSIAVVPDRFFDIKGKAYPIDWDRKISVHSLPTYENYKDAIIYRINSKGKCHIPPLATIIFDEAMENLGTLEIIETELSGQTEKSISVGKYLEGLNYSLYEEGCFSEETGEEGSKITTYYIPYDSFDTKLNFTESEAEGTYKFKPQLKVFKIANSEEAKKALLPPCLNIIEADMFEGTLVSYFQNHAYTNTPLFDTTGSVITPNMTCAIEEGHYLAIVVDNNNNYIPLIGKLSSITDNENTNAQKTVVWYQPNIDIDTTQFKGLDMWLRFESINEMIYFLITKYEDNIMSIKAATIHPSHEEDGKWAVNKDYTEVKRNSDLEADRVQGKLWAYVNPRTMTPYPDDYWFNEGEAYYVKSLTLAPEGKNLKGNKITVTADQWPGMYMLVGETWLRSRDTGEDERLQIRIPSCKVKADQTLTLEAAGDPVVFTLSLEVAKPQSGKMMEVTAYEIATKMIEGENGCYYAVDGSSEVLSE